MSRELISPTAELDVLGTQWQQLRLTRVAQTLPTPLEQAASAELRHSAFLQAVLATEVAAKQEKHQPMRVQTARFPFHKTSTASTGKHSPRLMRR